MSWISRYIQGEGGGGKGDEGASRPATEEPNTLKSQQTARVVEVLSEGPIHGVKNGLAGVYLNKTPVKDSAGNRNFRGVNMSARNGWPSQSVLPGFDAVEVEEPVGSEVLQSTPIVRSVTDLEADAVRVKIRIPGMTKQDPATGDLKGTKVAIRVDVQKDGGGWRLVYRDTIEGKTVSPYERQYRIDINAAFDTPPTTSLEVRVRRATVDSDTDATINNKTFFASFTTIREIRLMYSDTAVLGLEIDAAQFGTQVPSRIYHVQGRRLRIPSNYSTSTRAYTGIWDGTFKLVPDDDPVCVNPVWVLLDLLTNKRYGLGRVMDDTLIDTASFYDAATYCDETVADGFGGFESRYSFNHAFRASTDAYSAVMAVASTFRGMVYWGETIVLAIDKPGDTFKLVNNTNVVGGNFNYQSGSLKDRHNIVRVAWNDPSNFGEEAYEIIEDQTSIDRFGRRELNVQALGCISRGQARRFGKWILETEKTSSRILTYQASLDHADVKPGDIVEVMDADDAEVEHGGRVTAHDGSDPPLITIDQTLTLDSSKTYTLSYVSDQSDASIVTDLISLSGGEVVTNQLQTITPGIEKPNVSSGLNGTWTLSSSDNSTVKYRVFQVVEVSLGVFEISASLHDPTKYNRIDNVLSLPSDSAPIFSVGGPVDPPRNLEAQLLLIENGNEVSTKVVVSWTQSIDTRVSLYEVEVKDPESEGFTSWGTTAGVFMERAVTSYGDYTIRVTAITALNERSSQLEGVFDLSSIGDRPDNPTNFAVNVSGELATFTWDAITNNPAALLQYEIRYTTDSIGDSTWGTGVPYATVPKDQLFFIGPATPGTYMLKARDIFGRKNGNAGRVAISNNDLANYNTIFTLTEHPTFAGTKTDVFVDSSTLQLLLGDVMADWVPLSAADPLAGDFSSGAFSGTYEFGSDPVDLGAKFAVRATLNVEGDPVASPWAGFMSSWYTLAQVEALDGTTITETGEIRLFIRTTDDDPAASPTWSAWQQFGGRGTYTGRGFELKIELHSDSGLYSPGVDLLTGVFDMPDRQDTGSGTSSASAANSHTFTKAFYSTSPEVLATITNEQSGDYTVISNESRTGFDIEIFDNTDTRVARNFTWVATGYGEEVT